MTDQTDDRHYEECDKKISYARREGGGAVNPIV
jgi:hypothetical protein